MPLLLTLGIMMGAVSGVQAAETVPTETVMMKEGQSPAMLMTEGPWKDMKVHSVEDAAAVLEETKKESGYSKLEYEPFRTLDDTLGNHYYVFQQVQEGIPVFGGSVKVVADGEKGLMRLRP